MTTALPPGAVVHCDARIVLGVLPEHADLPGSWYISHGLGNPAAGTYTEVTFDPFVPEDEDGAPYPPEVLERATRQAAVSLYGTAWAFLYPPEQAQRSVHGHGLRRRERVVIANVEVWA